MRRIGKMLENKENSLIIKGVGTRYFVSIVFEQTSDVMKPNYASPSNDCFTLKRPGVTLMELIAVLAILIALAAVVIPIGDLGVREMQTTQLTPHQLTNLREAVLRYYQDMKGIAVVRDLGDPTGPPETTQATGMPNSLVDLQIAPKGVDGKAISYDPVTRRGWRGPYLLSTPTTFRSTNLHGSFAPYGRDDKPAFLDAWLNPVVVQWPATLDSLEIRSKYIRLVSAGPPSGFVQDRPISVLETRADRLMPTKPTSLQPNLPNERGNDLLLFLLVQDEYP